ncbi:phage tail assembly chaperone (plasmid) [Burkholderia vietnamiensis]|uniref:Phage tail protein n=1 Tax=Burkholderia vietnamiensis (strain G4 / LMG 22486) TaxID=269482 RepID=A4JWI7_BURVG|nr:hypothetical protein Bcep1808_7770 [Burkholderia vietnamiensis G4]MCB4349816.1 phage tail assembly chaperone [Burkholderia vietnamiensis]
MSTVNFMLHVEQAAFILSKKFPSLVRCKDYWVSHPVHEKTYEQRLTAWVPIWEPTDIPQPTPADLLAWWPDYADEYALAEETTSARQKRDDLLKQVDPMVERAADAGDADFEAALRKYRQALRDVPAQAGFPFNVTWPTLPAKSAE